MVTVRPFEINDIDAINVIFDEIDEMHREARPDFFKKSNEPFRTVSYYEKFGADTDELFVADIDGNIVGFLEISIKTAGNVPIMIPRKVGFVDTLAVSSRLQRSGVGAALMEQAEAWSREKGAQSVDFMVWHFNDNAIAFYEHRGYSEVMRRMSKPL